MPYVGIIDVSSVTLKGYPLEEATGILEDGITITKLIHIVKPEGSRTGCLISRHKNIDVSDTELFREHEQNANCHSHH